MVMPDTLLDEGTRIENFEILRRLGRGGFGVTYLATEFSRSAGKSLSQGFRREVAIKEFFPQGMSWRTEDSRVIPSQSDGAEEAFNAALKAFLREAQAISQIDHPNVVRILSVFEMNGTAYFVMPYLRGSSLRSLLRARGTLTQQEIETMVLPALDGLEEVHQNGVIHRDIKPDNVMVRDGNNKPILIDFGAARIEASDDAQQYTRMTELVAYTPGFAPIEQYARAARGNRHGAFTDIYSFSGLLYHCVTGQVPVEATLRALDIQSGRQDPLLCLSQIPEYRRRYAPSLLAGIDWGLELAGPNRPQSVRELRDCILGTTQAPIRQRSLAPFRPDDTLFETAQGRTGQWSHVPSRSTRGQTAPFVSSDSDGTAFVEHTEHVVPTRGTRSFPEARDPAGSHTNGSKSSIWSAKTLAGSGMLAIAVAGGGWWAANRSNEPVDSRSSAAPSESARTDPGLDAVVRAKAKSEMVIALALAITSEEDAPDSVLAPATAMMDVASAKKADGKLTEALTAYESAESSAKNAAEAYLLNEQANYARLAKLKTESGDDAMARDALAQADHIQRNIERLRR